MSNDDLHLKQYKWSRILMYALDNSNEILFNILFEGKEFTDIINYLRESILGIYNIAPKIYNSGKVIRLALNEDTKRFILDKKWAEWKGFPLEDVSFIKDDIELVATITHEDYILINLTDEEKIIFEDNNPNLFCLIEASDKFL
ncbi:hypothetical protein [Hymenobacter cavernae]|nr:hypothetical protein [Hymenobacter cavernae]